jgi:hypothetical protein
LALVVLALHLWLLVLKAVTLFYHLYHQQAAAVVDLTVVLALALVVLVVVLVRVHYPAQVTKAAILQ